MKPVNSHYRAVILCESVMMCSALAASIFSQPLNHRKCDVEDMRKVVKHSCDFGREKRSAVSAQNETDLDSHHRFTTSQINQEEEEHIIPQDLLPPNSKLHVIRKRQKLLKNSQSGRHKIMVLVCCENICDELKCTP